MVLERIYDAGFIQSNKSIVILLGAAYSIFGIAFSIILFPNDPALIAIAFTCLISLVSLRGVLISEKNNPLSSGIVGFIYENRDKLIIFSYLFLGILLTFAIFSIFIPSLSANALFSNQLDFIYTLSAKEIFNFGDINYIFFNNAKVLLTCLIASFLFGIGTIFLFIIVWNASVIGVAFGLAAKESAIAINQSPFIYLLLILAAALPHILLEISSYFIGGITGDKLSNLILSEDAGASKKYFWLGIVIFLILSVIILYGAALIETKLTPVFVEMLV